MLQHLLDRFHFYKSFRNQRLHMQILYAKLPTQTQLLNKSLDYAIFTILYVHVAYAQFSGQIRRTPLTIHHSHRHNPTKPKTTIENLILGQKPQALSSSPHTTTVSYASMH